MPAVTEQAGIDLLRDFFEGRTDVFHTSLFRAAFKAEITALALMALGHKHEMAAVRRYKYEEGFAQKRGLAALGLKYAETERTGSEARG